MRLTKLQTLAAVCLVGVAACGGTTERDDAVGETGAGWRSTGFEIIDGPEGIAWMAVDITAAEFEALALPPGWISNPRDLEASFGEFLMSPAETEPGRFEELDLLGHRWRHVATLSDRGQPADDAGLLVSTRVDKHHRLTFEAGLEMTTLTSPDGETFLRVTRDPARTQDVPSVPAGWTLDAFTPEETTVVLLTPPTLLLRTDNEDSFQGPVDLDGVAP
jgi:hypothetical protein